MASLKEIRARIASVASTQKITNAMKMVSAAKLKKAEATTLKFVPYQTQLTEALTRYLASLEESVSIPLAQHRDVKKTVLMAFSSNNGLCGVYNSNINKLLKATYDEYAEKIGAENVIVFTIGKKANDYAKRIGMPVENTFLEIGEKPRFDTACAISDLLADMFLTNKVDKVEMIFNHYKNTGVQIPQRKTVLPLNTTTEHDSRADWIEYIVEPSKESFINALAPKVLRTNIYAVMLDAFTAEHGARTTAMHIASDNANELLNELRIQYNKARQNVITNELIDIVGGAEAQKG